MESTFIILKPDCIERRKVGLIIDRLEQAGFEIIACKLEKLNSAVLREHYSHIADRPFFPSIEEFMSSRPVFLMVLRGEGVIGRVRTLVGPTDPKNAAAGTIRGDWGTDVMRNLIHASDGPDAAQDEISRFFPEITI